MLAFQSIRMGRTTKIMSVRVLKAAMKSTLAWVHVPKCQLVHTLLVGYKKVKLDRSALIGQLLHYIVVQVWSTAKEDIKEGGGWREDAGSDGNVYDDEVPALNDDACKKDAEWDLEDHHRQDVAGFAGHGPLQYLARVSRSWVT
jgi:hypothetical protein